MDDQTLTTIVAAILQAGYAANPASDVTVPDDEKAVSWALDLQEEAAKQLRERHQKDLGMAAPPPPPPERDNELCGCGLPSFPHVKAYHNKG